MHSVLGFSPVFGENVNIMLLVVVVTYLTALILGLVSIFLEKLNAVKIKKIAYFMAC